MPKKSLDPAAVEALAKCWADALARGEEARDDDIHQQVVMLSFFYTPDVQWSFIRAAVSHVDRNNLGTVAAGPFEGLMGPHGEAFIDKVESEAAQNPRFREMVRDSWRHSMTDEVWERVQAIQALPPR